MELFLAELERRMHWIEQYRKSHMVQIDSQLRSGYAALEAVRDQCSVASGELMGSGKKRAKILVETLEHRYNDALATKETLEQKAQASVRLMESFLSELESRAHAVRDRGIYGTLDDGWKAMDSKLVHAREVVDEGMERARRARHALKENIEEAIRLAQEQRLITYSDLPDPWRVNPHILKGYRFTTSKVECVSSIFAFSNYGL